MRSLHIWAPTSNRIHASFWTTWTEMSVVWRTFSRSYSDCAPSGYLKNIRGAVYHFGDGPGRERFEDILLHLYSEERFLLFRRYLSVFSSIEYLAFVFLVLQYGLWQIKRYTGPLKISQRVVNWRNMLVCGCLAWIDDAFSKQILLKMLNDVSHD